MIDAVPLLIAVIEDEAVIASAIEARLRAEGFRVEVARDGAAGVALCERVRPDLVVLDLMLPGLDGVEVCRRIQRQRPVPVLMLTARDAEEDVLVGLGVGADDYMTKPFSPRELVARVRALLRRVERRPAPPVETIRAGELELDPAGRRVRVGGREVHLTPTEFDLLALMAARPGVVFSREQLLADVWGWREASGTRTVDSHVRGLRSKVGSALVRTVHGIGYAFEPGGRDVRPLDRVPSIKLKLGLVIVGTVAGTVIVLVGGYELGLELRWRVLVATALGLLMVQFLARGMTSPLREMAAAASAMARGEYGRRVRATSRDEVGELARAFNAMAADLADVERQRRDLVANVSHELRTPIGALQALLENLVDGVEPPDPEALRTALAQTERLGRLVAQLLDLSRLEAGAVPMAPRPFEVRPLLEQATRECALGESSGVRLKVCVQPGDLHAHGDPERVHQVVANLLDNAVRHSPASGRVWLSAYALSGRTAIEVADEGAGIPAGEAQRVFERFHRVDAARSASAGGSGLGLAIARWIVDAHGGTIRAEQRDPHGCRMVVELPA